MDCRFHQILKTLQFQRDLFYFVEESSSNIPIDFGANPFISDGVILKGNSKIYNFIDYMDCKLSSIAYIASISTGLVLFCRAVTKQHPC